MTTKEFFKKMDDFEDNHPIICGFIKVISGTITFLCILFICLIVKYVL